MDPRDIVFATLRKHKLMLTADEDGDGYPLVDAMTPDGETIASGEIEMHRLADEIALALAR